MSNTTFNERDLDFIVTALNAHWYDAHHNLERKDLGDIERKNYEFQLARSKELMGSIINPTPSKELKSAEADNLSIDELLSEFKRQGFDTSNWDGDEGAEKAIVDGVRNHIAELHPSPTHDVTEAVEKYKALNELVTRFGKLEVYGEETDEYMRLYNIWQPGTFADETED